MKRLLSIILIASMSLGLFVGFGAKVEAESQIPPVTNLKVEELRNGYVKISFDPVPGASHYTVKRNGSNIGNIKYETSLEHPAPMVVGTPYTYEIRAVVNGVQGPAGLITVVGPEKVPSPTNVVGTSNSPTSIQLNWDPVPNATDYVITINHPKRPLGASITPSFEHTGLIPNSIYSYFIQARIGDVYSDQVHVSATTLSYTPLSAPADFKVTGKTHNSVSLSWSPVTGADKYVITDANSNVVYEGALTSTSVSNLTADTGYTFELVARNNFGQTSPSSTISVTTGIEMIPYPTDFTVTKVTYDQVDLIWNPVIGAESYTLYRDDVELVTSQDTAFTDRSVEENTKYVYSVTANKGGRSSQPVLKEVTTPIKPPVDPGTGGGTNPPTDPGTGGGTDPGDGNGGSTTPPPTTEGNGGSTNSSKPDEGNGNTGTGKGSESSKDSNENNSGKTPIEFVDVKDNHFASVAIKELSYKGIITGYSNGTFAPNKAVTRAEFAIMLKRVLSLKDSSGFSNKFTDLSKNAWYAEELSVALHHSIAKGFTDKTFRPNQLISREQAAVMISNILRDKGFTYEGLSIDFKDTDQISLWALEDVKLSVEIGIVKGYENNTFLPQAYVTRGEAAVLIQRLLKVIN
ncbi:S-layer homology domain-containing protein [Paenibacillus dendritiformis]|uniref:S-layer homology domain-containing protein n=1 Tax=Paenibacillus dendritiformis TaxID=130049 RepID=UPI003660B2F7